MPKLGSEAKLYYSTAALSASNPPGSASWNEIKNCRDLTLGMDKGEADVTTRGHSGYRATLPTLKEVSIEFEMMWEPSDTAFQKIRDAYLSNTLLAMAVMDGAIGTSGNQGFTANMGVISFSRGEPLEEGMTVSVTVKPSSYIGWYEVS